MKPDRILSLVALGLALALGTGAMAQQAPGRVVASESPAEWQRIALGALSVAIPPDWVRVEDRSASQIWFGGDMGTITGPAVGLIRRSTAASVYGTGEVEILGQVMLADGTLLEAAHARVTLDRVETDAMIYRTLLPDAEGDLTGLFLGAYNRPYESQAALFATVLGSLRGVAPVPEPVVQPGSTGTKVLAGQVTLTLPEGWDLLGGPRDPAVSLLAPDRAGFVTLARGAGVTGPEGVFAAVPEAAVYRGDAVMGHPADRYEWSGSLPEFREDGVLVPGTYRLYVLRDCLPGDERIALQLAGSRSFLGGAALSRLLGAMESGLPADAPACPETPDPEPELAATPAAPPALPPEPPAPPVVDNDRFTDQGGGYALYENDRYGTVISYPSAYYAAQEPPANGDGRRFVSADGSSEFYVFAQFNALGLSLAEMMAQDAAGAGYDEVTYQRAGADWYVLSGHVGGAIFYRRVLYGGMDGLFRVFEIRYPKAAKESFDKVVAYMAQSFGPAPEPVAAPVQPQIRTQPQPQDQVALGTLYTPARGTQERGAIMEAARVPVVPALGQKVIFLVSVLNSDGHWAYLQAVPLQPDGRPLDWSTTPFAAEMRADAMSDVIMVLLRNDGGGWRVVDYVIGPTDVHWYGWLDLYGVPERLFR